MRNFPLKCVSTFFVFRFLFFFSGEVIKQHLWKERLRYHRNTLSLLVFNSWNDHFSEKSSSESIKFNDLTLCSLFLMKKKKCWEILLPGIFFLKGSILTQLLLQSMIEMRRGSHNWHLGDGFLLKLLTSNDMLDRQAVTYLRRRRSLV